MRTRRACPRAAQPTANCAICANECQRDQKAHLQATVVTTHNQSMATQKQGSALADRVYKSSIPLKQLKFSEPKKRVKYGKQTSKRIPQSDQGTFTQMDFVKLLQHIDEEDKELKDYEYTAEKRQKRRRGRTATLQFEIPYTDFDSD